MKGGITANSGSLVTAALLLIAVLCTAAAAATVAEVTQALTCPCGCNMVVSACEGSMECTAAARITDQVTRMVHQGRSKEEIVSEFVRTHGERILAAPTKEGFNLTAWILPFGAILIAGVLVYVFLARCLAARAHTLQTRTVAPPGQGDSEYWIRMEKELRQREV